ncbi:hypothetical protein DOY81_010610 [Sarcophaga bullata]|nr:hypothetical protein DOY81_010610 [Sarcophaga bullata]
MRSTSGFRLVYDIIKLRQMVNESNKPQPALEHDELSQRLANSNQALADMQAEHRQLMEEMEQLRRRAEDLQRLREQQEREEQERRQAYEQQSKIASETTETEVLNSTTAEDSKESEEAGDAEEADYIKEKLAEIARLKAQFKRVQHMINTTELIENHMSKKEKVVSDNKTQVADTKTKATVPPAAVEPSVPIATPLTSIAAGLANIDTLTMPQMPTMADLNAAATTDEKEQLIMTMLSMFQDFSSDLRSQADNLRAEEDTHKRTERKHYTL